MKPILRGGAAATLSALVLAGGLAGCGGGRTPSSTPVWPGLHGSASAAPTTPGTGTPSAPRPGSAVAASAIAARLQQAAAATKTAHLTMTVGLGGKKISAQGDLQAQPLAENMTISVMGMSISMRYVDDTAYLKVPALGMGDTWVKASATELGSMAGLGSLTSLTDPLAVWSKVGGAIKGARYDGSDAVGQHYTVQMDSATLISAMGYSASEASRLGSSVPSTVSEDVWFSGDHVVQTTVALGSTGVVTVTMSNFGEPVNVTAPPAGQTQDLGGLSGLGAL